MIAVFRNQDATPKEGYVHHAAGLGGYGASSYIDSVILRDRDANGGGGWTGASDGTLEERRYYCQNWRADVVAITTSEGFPLEYIRYSSYGEPTVYPVSDINMDGMVNTTDLTEWSLLQGAASTNAAYATSDINFDGSEDSLDGDLFYFDSYLPNSGLSGKGKLSSPAVGNRIGYAGYAWDPTIKAYHVRHRVLLPEIGRWSRRDPIGYVGALSLYEYVNLRPLAVRDPSGLLAAVIDMPFSCIDGWYYDPIRNQCVPNWDFPYSRVCCRHAYVGGKKTWMIHCEYVQKFASCAAWAGKDPVEREYPVQRRSRGALPDGTNCRDASVAQIRRCLDMNPHTNGNLVPGSNCQTRVGDGLSRCCLQSDFEPNWYAKGEAWKWVIPPLGLTWQFIDACHDICK